MTYELDLGEDAEADIDEILKWSVARFGEAVRDGYQALIEAVLDSIVSNPARSGSHERNDLGRNIRSLHLRTCRAGVYGNARRIASPRDFVIYRRVGSIVQVVRVLHDAMDISAQPIR